MRALCAALGSLLLAGTVCADGPTFTRKPEAVESGGKVAISFAVDRTTDVAVSVANAGGKVVIGTADYLTRNPKDAGKFLTLNVIAQDGKTKRTVIWQCLNGAIPRVDAKGNIYLADLVKPPERSYPEFFDGKLPAPPKQCTGGDLFWHSYMYGSILKFPPEGGIIWHQKELPKSCVGKPPAALLAKPRQPFKRHFSSSLHLTGEVQGALWTRFGYAPYSAHMSGNTSHCMCEGSGFDVDPRVKKPDIPLAWPTYVAVSDRWTYVADTVNQRVVRVRLNYAAEETCSLAEPAGR